MWGAIIGDISGSRFEFIDVQPTDFELLDESCCFTDDTVLTVAVADTLLCYDEIKDEEQFKRTLVSKFHDYAVNYHNRGFGGRFRRWFLLGETQPYNSFGNGSAMRVSPVGWYARSLQEAERIAKLTAEVTHNHPEGIKGAQSVAGAIWLARKGSAKQEIRRYIEEKYGYNLNISIDELRRQNVFDVTCQVTVPIAIKCFLECSDYVDTIKTAISIGGDTDTVAAIGGSIAEAFYGIDDGLKERAKVYLDKRILGVIQRFSATYQK